MDKSRDDNERLLRLLSLHADGLLGDDDRKELAAMVAASDEARRIYIEHMFLHSMMHRAARLTGPAPVLPDELTEAAGGWSEDRGLPSEAERAPILDFLGEVFRAGASFFSRTIVLTFLWAVGLPGILLLILVLSIARQPGPETPVAALTRTHECVWSENSAAWWPGADVYADQRLELRKGLAEITFARGAKVLLEGPATFMVAGDGRGFLRDGRVVANVPRGAEGFTIATPSATIVDLGTEFGVDANRASGDVVVEVLKGKVEVGLVDHSTEPREKRVLSQGQSVLARGGQYLAAPAISFVRQMPPADALEIPPEYVDAVKKAGPVAYWRFETREGDRTPNEMGPANTGQLIGRVSLGGWDRNRTLSLPAVKVDRCMLVDSIVGAAGGNYSIELWMRPESDNPGMMFAAVAGPRKGEKAGKLVSIQRGISMPDPSPERIRFGYQDIGQSRTSREVQSGAVSRVGDWHHVVGVKEQRLWRLYVDGRCVRTLNDQTALAEFTRITVGRSTFDRNVVPKAEAGQEEPRYFVGQLDEVAVYNRALSAEEIARHSDLVKPNR